MPLTDADGVEIKIGDMVIGATEDHPLRHRPTKVLEIHGRVVVADCNRDFIGDGLKGGKRRAFRYTAPSTFLGSLLRHA